MNSQPPYSVGIDPDLHCTAFALVNEERVIAARVVKVPKELKGREAQEAMVSAIGREIPSWIVGLCCPPSYAPSVVVAEGQQIYAHGKTKNWDSILILGAITGAAAICCSLGTPQLLIPKPKDWKGDVPKGIHQARVLKRRGFEYVTKGGKNPYCVPTMGPWGFNMEGDFNMKATEWKHVVDAIGLADWGLGQI